MAILVAMLTSDALLRHATADTKSTAKTIDMCNNPQTKTPKLENAKRIASGSLATHSALTLSPHTHT
jgi:hypothetical protein